MKKLLLIILLVVAVMSCCSRHPKDFPEALGPYSKDVCELMVRAQYSPMIERKELCCSLYSEVEKAVQGDTSKHTKAVLLYIQASLNGNTYLFNRRDSLERALSLADTVKYPVLKHRLKAELLKLDPHVAKENYLAIKNEIDYFRSIGDSLQTALMEFNLGAFFQDAGQTQEALAIVRDGLATCKKINQPKFESLARINEALYYGEMGDSVASDSIHKILLADENIRRDLPKFREGILRNAYLQSGDTAFLNEGWEIVSVHPEMKRTKSLYYLIFAKSRIVAGDADSALKLLIKGKELEQEFGYMSEHSHLMSLNLYATAFEKMDLVDSAYYYLKKANELADSLRALDLVVETMREKYQQDMLAMEYEQEHRRNNERWVWSLVVFAVFVVGTIWIVWVWRQRNRTMVQLAQEQSEIERTRRQLAANILAKQEKDNLLTEMNRHIHKMSEEGQIDKSAASDLQIMIRLHATGKKEWEAFEELLVKVKPRFMKRLREVAPDMTMKYCRLAAYLYVGMSSQQIARLLAIRPASVYQARWRLRSYLHLEADQLLETFLEKLGE